jgi:hypothetical protein
MVPVAPADDPGTVAGVSRNGYALRARAEQIAANVRGAYASVDDQRGDPGPAPLADVIPLVVPPPPLEHPPTTRTIDDKGRVSVRLGGRALHEVMGWEPGALSCRPDGVWVVLRPHRTRCGRRNDGTARIGGDGRLRLPAPTRRLLGVVPSDEVAVLALPAHDAVALCHPARLLVGAPLSLLQHPPSGENDERNQP